MTPTFNRAGSIARTIESVLAQSYPHWRMLVVDDASTDETLKVVAPYAQRDPRIRVLERKQNGGVLVARNDALEHLPAEVSWLTSVDSDDYLLPDALAVMAEHIRRMPDVRVFCFGTRYTDGTPTFELESPRFGTYADYLLGRNPRGEWAQVMQRSFVDDGLRFDERLRRDPLVGLFLRIARITPFYYVPSVVRMMARDNVSITRPAQRDRSFYEEQAQVHEVYLECFGDDLKALSPKRFSNRLAQYAEACAHAGRRRRAWSAWLRSVWALPWRGKHLRKLVAMHRALADSRRSDRIALQATTPPGP